AYLPPSAASSLTLVLMPVLWPSPRDSGSFRLKLYFKQAETCCLAACATSEEAAGGRVFKGFSTTGQAWVRHEIFVSIERLLAGCGLYARRGAVRQELPALLIVLEIGHHDLVEHLLVHGHIEHGAEHLDATVEGAGHEVGGGDVDGGLRMRQRMAGPEAIDPAVLEEPTDDRLDTDAIGQSRYSRPQATDAAHDQIDLHAGARGRIERVDDLRVDQRIQLHPDRGRPACLGVHRLLADVIEDPRSEIERRDRHLLDLGRLGVAGYEIEDARYVAGDHRV